MFIYHFNRMIRSRILWIVFAIVIAVAFLSVDSCYRNPSGSAPEQDVNTAGTVGGEPVSYDEYEFTKQLLQGSTANLEPAATETQVWAHIAAMRTVKELGITATGRELADRILATPDFQIDGAFNRNRYEQVVRNALGVSVQTFERMQAQYIVLYKLMAVVSAGAAPSQMEIDDELGQYTDEFSFRYATLSDTHAGEEIEAGDEAIADYYGRHSDDFALPARVGVSFVSLAATNFLDAVVLEDVEADIQDIYESDPSKYTRRGTNGVEQLTLEEARGQILDELKTSEAIHIATTNLVAFMEDLGDASLKDFTWRAKARGLAVRETPLFAYEADFIPGVEASALEEFRTEASDLDEARADARFAIARGRRNVYLMRIATNDVAHVQALEEVAGAIRPLVVAEKRAALFDADVEKAMSSLKSKMEGKENFAEAFTAACAELELPVSSNITFTLTGGGAEKIEHSRELIPAVLRMKTGDMSDSVKIPGGALIVCLDSRTRSDSQDASFEVASARDRIAAQRSQASDARFFAEWLVQNLKEKGFTSKALSNILSDDTAEDDDISDEEAEEDD